VPDGTRLATVLGLALPVPAYLAYSMLRISRTTVILI
jgi:hypothetical protein